MINFSKKLYLYIFYFAVTIVSSIIMFLLILSEFNSYLSQNISEELFVDTTRSHKLKINLDIQVPMISCNCKQLSFEIMLLVIYC